MNLHKSGCQAMGGTSLSNKTLIYRTCNGFMGLKINNYLRKYVQVQDFMEIRSSLHNSNNIDTDVLWSEQAGISSKFCNYN